MGLRPFYTSGKHFQVYSLEVPGAVPAESFLEETQDAKSRNGRAKERLLNAIEMRANMPIHQHLGGGRFKFVTDYPKIFEFKADQLRLFGCFASGGRIVLLNGAFKQADNSKEYKKSARKAEELRQWFEAGATSLPTASVISPRKRGTGNS